MILLHQQYWLCPQGSNKILQLLYSHLLKQRPTLKSLTEYPFLTQYLFSDLGFQDIPPYYWVLSLMETKVDVWVRCRCGSGIWIESQNLPLRDLSCAKCKAGTPPSLLLPPKSHHQCRAITPLRRRRAAGITRVRMRRCFLPSLLRAHVCYSREHIIGVSSASWPGGGLLRLPLRPVRVQLKSPLCQLFVFGLLILISSLITQFGCAYSGVFLTRSRSVINQEETPDPNYLACRSGRYLHLKWPSKRVSAWPFFPSQIWPWAL